MREISLTEFESIAEEYDRDVMRTPGIDHFCSSTDWILPAHRGLMPPRRPWIRRGDGSWAVFAIGPGGDGQRYLQPLEAAWALGTPLITNDLVNDIPEFVGACLDDGDSWDALLISGLIEESPLFRILAAAFASTGLYDLFRGPVTRRYCASLEGGLDGFLGRRSRYFRRNMRRAQRRGRDAGVLFEDLLDMNERNSHGLFERMMVIEERSWKGQAGVGINQGSMRRFYERIVPRLTARDALWVSFAQLDGRDIGYIFGGGMGDTYRGLQFSFDRDYAQLSVGNLMQMHTVELLCQRNYDAYDLGSDADYKQAWAEGGQPSVALVVRR